MQSSSSGQLTLWSSQGSSQHRFQTSTHHMGHHIIKEMSQTNISNLTLKKATSGTTRAQATAISPPQAMLVPLDKQEACQTSARGAIWWTQEASVMTSSRLRHRPQNCKTNWLVWKLILLRILNRTILRWYRQDEAGEIAPRRHQWLWRYWSRSCSVVSGSWRISRLATSSWRKRSSSWSTSPIYCRSSSTRGLRRWRQSWMTSNL